MKIFFHPKAEEELKEAVLYYEECQKGLGLKFLNEINKSLKRLKLFPFSSQLIEDDIRRCLVNRFPFGIIYFVNDKKIIVLAIMHLKKKPGYWKDRLK